MTRETRMLSFVAAGLAGGLASVAAAQPFMINGTGATLLQAVFRAPASTNDFIDVDGDCLIAIDGDQLAPFDSAFPWDPSQQWQVTYRVVGSVNGFIELRDWGFTYLIGPDGDAGHGTYIASFSDESLWNRDKFVIAGVTQGSGVADNPGATPVRSLTDGSFAVTTSTANDGTTGIQVDFASLDVPIAWAVRQTGSTLFNRVPGAPGYGSNAILPVNNDGTLFTGDPDGNRLPSLVGLNGDINVNYASPDEFTAYDTAIANAPVGAMVNYGVGMQEILMSDLRHLNATGRRENGENLMVVTRDVGSGTRNAYMNGICLDPSWGNGENNGARTVSSSKDRLGPDFQPSNKGGSSRVEGTVRNHRLSTGHTGAERGQSQGWLTNGLAEFMAVEADIKGGTTPARPSLPNVLNGGIDGYNITGPAVLSHLGDPASAPEELGGLGWLEPFTDLNANCLYDLGEPFIDINGSGVRDATEPRPGVLNPAIRNDQAAAYVNNFKRSIQVFTDDPGVDETLFTPGEFMALNYVLVAAAEFVPDPFIDPNDPCIILVPNPDYNEALHDFIRDESGNVLGDPEFLTFNTTSAGQVPSRTTGVAYSDAAAPGGSPTGQAYVDQAGNSISYGSLLTRRNLIAFDFSGDGVRDINDATQMIAAWRDRNGGPAWVAPVGTGIIAGEPGTDAIIEVLGDGNGDGNFDAEDVRYFADGLAMVDDGLGGTVLDRKAGFIAVDTAFGGNFFGTGLATPPKPYVAGDSRGDVATGDEARDAVTGQITGALPNYRPQGDGQVDGHDIDYVYLQFKQNPAVTDGVANWRTVDHDPSEAIFTDLSADIDGDLDVDQDDVSELVMTILGTDMGDVDLDGDCDTDDLSAALSNLGNAGGWADGDVDGDGTVTQDDLDQIQDCINGGCPDPNGCGDWDNSGGQSDGTDFFSYLDSFAAGDSCADLAAPAGLGGEDFFAYLDRFVIACP